MMKPQHTPAVSARARLRLPFTSRFLDSAMSKSLSAARWESADAWIELGRWSLKLGNNQRRCWDLNQGFSQELRI